MPQVKNVLFCVMEAGGDGGVQFVEIMDFSCLQVASYCDRKKYVKFAELWTLMFPFG